MSEPILTGAAEIGGFSISLAAPFWAVVCLLSWNPPYTCSLGEWVSASGPCGNKHTPSWLHGSQTPFTAFAAILPEARMLTWAFAVSSGVLF